MQAAQGYPEPVLKLRDLLNTYLGPEKVALVLRAYDIAEEAHRGQIRKTGEPYIYHPVAVAQILADRCLADESIAAAILHDTIEDTPVGWSDIEQGFGREIADLVEGVTKLDKMKFRTRVEADAAGAASREFPEDAPGDEPGYPGPDRQAHRPVGQHAHTGQHVTCFTAPDRPGNPRYLRTDCRPARDEQHAARTGRDGVFQSLPLAP